MDSAVAWAALKAWVNTERLRADELARSESRDGEWRGQQIAFQKMANVLEGKNPGGTHA